MLKLEFDLQKKKGWFENSESTLTASLIPENDLSSNLNIPVSIFLEVLLQELQLNTPRLSQILSNTADKLLLDIRGCPEEELEKKFSPRTEFSREEIMFVHGVVPETNPAIPSEDYKIFEFQIFSAFEKFTSQNHIVYQVNNTCKGPFKEISQYLTPWDITKLMPLYIDEVRLGFEFFSPRYFGSMLGMAPLIQERLYLKLSPNKISAYAYDKNINQLPLEKSGLLYALHSALEKINLYPDLLGALNKDKK